MQYLLCLSPSAKRDLRELKKSPALGKRYKAVVKALRFLESNPRHPGLNTHIHTGYSITFKCKIFEAYAENNTPGAYRIFWCYGEERNVIQVVAIVPHE